MNRLRLLFSLIIFVACCPAIAALADDVADMHNGYEVIRAEFGIFNQRNSAEPVFIPATVVPFTPNQGYGWVMFIRTAKEKIKWREEFILPAKPDTWGDPEPLGTRLVSTDGRVSVTEREVSPGQGVIFNTWAVAHGDPKGRYIIKVFVEDSLVKVFEFDVK